MVKLPKAMAATLQIIIIKPISGLHSTVLALTVSKIVGNMAIASLIFSASKSDDEDISNNSNPWLQIELIFNNLTYSLTKI